MAATLLSVAAKSAAGRDSAVARAVDALPQVRTNLSSAERWVSLAAGGALFGLGFDGKGPGLASSLVGGYLLYRALTGNCLAYQALGFSTSDSTAPASAVAAGHGTRVEHVVTVNKPVDQVYAFWRDFENLPRFMAHLVDVDTTTDGRSRWIAKGPLGLQVEWEAELVTDTPNRVIAWKSLDGADVDTAGSVRFTELPHGQGTEVRVELKYDPPAGKLGSAVARLFGENPDRQVREDLRRFKQIMETGEARTTVDKATGRR
jgi:uncharacterized membrane protein